MELTKIKTKKSIMGPVISVFVMVLIVSILSGLTFLFVSQLKTQVGETSATATYTAANETITAVTESGVTLDGAALLLFSLDTNSVVVLNESSDTPITSGNYTLDSSGIIYSTGDADTNNTDWKVSYSGSYIGDTTAYQAVNKTEAAGAIIVNYLSLIFLAVIFGAILTLVLRIIIPYINLGQNMGGF